ncbi:hypothetical protein IMZ48_11050 [Candidatus Bathyarchaeota archaeon]|nr:hypothetical protein [Candidatus Bathyarchaeota archaeon]
MGTLETTPILEQLRSATTSAEKTAALRELKNDIIGHRQKKEAWVGAGVLEVMVKVLVTCQAPGNGEGKDSRSQVGSHDAAGEESVKLQAIQALSTFANGAWDHPRACLHQPQDKLRARRHGSS